MSNWREESEANVRTESSRSFHEMFGVLKLAGDPQFEPGLGQYNTYIKRPCGKVDECAGFRYTFFLCVCVCVCVFLLLLLLPGWHISFFFFFFSLGKKREKKCFKKNGVSKEREKKTHKNLCAYYTLSLARARRHTEICRTLGTLLLLRLTRAFENTTQTIIRDPTHERDDDDDDDAPEKSRRFTNDDPETTTTVRRVPTKKVVAKRRHAFRRDDVLHRL